MRTKDFVSLMRKLESSYTFDAIITSVSPDNLDEYVVNIYGKGFFKSDGSYEAVTHTAVSAFDVEPGRVYSKDDQVKVYFLDLLGGGEEKEKTAIIKPYNQPTQRFNVIAVVNKQDGTKAGYVRAVKINDNGETGTQEFLVKTISDPAVDSIFYAHSPIGHTDKQVVSTDTPLGAWVANTRVQWLEIGGSGSGHSIGTSQGQLHQMVTDLQDGWEFLMAHP